MLRSGSFLADADRIAQVTVPFVHGFTDTLALPFNLDARAIYFWLVLVLGFRKFSRRVALQVLVATVYKIRLINIFKLV